MGRLIFQAESLQGLRFGIAVFVQPLVFVKLIDHLVEFFLVDVRADHIDGAPAAGFVEIAMVEHVALF